jgi:hypothetical protein
MRYDLWSAASGNRLGDFDSYDELAKVIREFAELNGVDAVDDLFAQTWPAGALQAAGLIGPAELLKLARPFVKTYVLTPLVGASTSTRQSNVSRTLIPIAV